MTNNISNSLAGLSLLTGSNLSSFAGTFTFESRAVRVAKAQFTAPQVTPPWAQKPNSASLPSQASLVRGLASIIENVRASGPVLPSDIQTAFTTYKALDRLRILAEFALSSSASLAEKTAVQNTFAKGLADLQSFLAGSPTDKLTFAFSQVSRRAQSVAVPPPVSGSVVGPAVVRERADPLSGLRGSEILQVTLSKSTGNDSVEVDLSTTTQPPTLDSVVAALNGAIAAIPMRHPDGTLALTEDGQQQSKWHSRFEAVKLATGWGISLATAGTELVGLDEVGANDALIVASGSTVLDAPTATNVMRFSDNANSLDRQLLGTISAVDRPATDLLAMKAPLIRQSSTEPKEVLAATKTQAIASDAYGFSYLVGTTAGDLGAHRSDGQEDLFLTKLDSNGKVIWQRTLGSAGKAEAAAVSVAPNGDVIVAGTVTGALDGVQSDGDMLVARFDSLGNEKFASIVRSVGAESATALAAGADGSIYVGGRAETGTGDAFLARLDASGKLQERRTIDTGSSDTVRSLAVDVDGSLLALTSEAGIATIRRLSGTSIAVDLGSVQIGQADARALAISSDGTIAVGGSTQAALPGTQANATSGGRDGFVSRISSSLGDVQTTYIGTSANDQVDSVAFMGGAIYAGGRTSGNLGGALSGATDGFVSKIDPASGSILTTTQFGRAAVQTDPVRVAALRGGDSSLSSLGLGRGIINQEVSGTLVTQTALRVGDEFSIRVNGGSLRRISIEANDTLASVANRLRLIAGVSGTVASARTEDGGVLRIDAKPGNSIDLIPGREGRDALAKLGINAGRLAARPILDADAPRVRPGGSFGLELSTSLKIARTEDASLALGRIKDALSMTQTAFRSLYWDTSKEALVNGGRSRGRVSPYEAAQLGRYQDALTRLSAPKLTLGF